MLAMVGVGAAGSSFASVYTAKLASPKYSAFTRLVECQEGRRARRMRRRRRNIEIEVEVKVEEKMGEGKEEEYTSGNPTTMTIVCYEEKSFMDFEISSDEQRLILILIKSS
ncbi:hypothetical protein V1478_011997 [Vespula squamosa]|uniref:Uncharacterized protein n=1 Tax=Vespula squamosa TaxID=30214 RepID=A0ABD2ABY3_VESSQ